MGFLAGHQLRDVRHVVTDTAVAEAERLLADPSSADEATARNYEIGLEHFSFAAVRDVYARAFRAVAD